VGKVKTIKFAQTRFKLQKMI